VLGSSRSCTGRCGRRARAAAPTFFATPTRARGRVAPRRTTRAAPRAVRHHKSIP
jgi:hypothetical protein